MTSADISAAGMSNTDRMDRGISAGSRTLTAFFDDRAAAQKATDDLVAAGVPSQHIKITAGAGTTKVAETAKATQDKSFWDELKDLFLPDEDRHSYAEGLRRGGYLLSAQVDEANYKRAMDILDVDGSVNLDEREATWRSEGWTGYSDASRTDAPAMPAKAASTSSAMGSLSKTAAPSTALGGELGSAAALAGRGAVDTERGEAIPVYEETAQVAKRDVNHGRVRLRSYVVETPINEEVSLRNESVQVERRPVDRPIGVGDTAFKDRVIEVEEHAEEAVISKQARVKEEVSIQKTVENRAQTISDTVRHTEVEVDDQRGGRIAGAAGSFVSATDRTKIVQHMDVIASDGTKVGTVDHLDGPDRIKLAKTTSPDGQHHYVPLNWVDHVDNHVHLNKSLAEMKAGQF